MGAPFDPSNFKIVFLSPEKDDCQEVFVSFPLLKAILQAAAKGRHDRFPFYLYITYIS